MKNTLQKKVKQCYFCVNNIQYIDYKDTQLLSRFLSPYAKIVLKKRTGTCSKHQRELSNAIKRARFMALIPYIRR
jgi:small subunit ribosomal protein S18